MIVQELLLHIDHDWLSGFVPAVRQGTLLHIDHDWLPGFVPAVRQGTPSLLLLDGWALARFSSLFDSLPSGGFH